MTKGVPLTAREAEVAYAAMQNLRALFPDQHSSETFDSAESKLLVLSRTLCSKCGDAWEGVWCFEPDCPTPANVTPEQVVQLDPTAERRALEILQRRGQV